MFTSLGLSDASVRGPGELHLLNELSLSVETSLCRQDTFIISSAKEVSTEPLPTTSTVPDPRLGTTSLFVLSWWWTGNDEIRVLRDWVWGTNHPSVRCSSGGGYYYSTKRYAVIMMMMMRGSEWRSVHYFIEEFKSLLLLLYVVLLSDRYNITQAMHQSL